MAEGAQRGRPLLLLAGRVRGRQGGKVPLHRAGRGKRCGCESTSCAVNGGRQCRGGLWAGTGEERVQGAQQGAPHATPAATAGWVGLRGPVGGQALHGGRRAGA